MLRFLVTLIILLGIHITCVFFNDALKEYKVKLMGFPALISYGILSLTIVVVCIDLLLKLY